MHKQLIMVGPTRTGTTSLFRFLGGDHRIELSTKKETNYFFMTYSGSKLSRREYLQNFPHLSGKAYTLEASPLYFMGGKKIARSIKSTMGDVKTVIILRNPLERFLSLFKHIRDKRSMGNELDFRQYTRQCLHYAPEKFAGLRDINEMSFREGCYTDLLYDWVEVIGQENVFLMFYEHLFDPLTQMVEIARLLKWLDLTQSDLYGSRLSVENASRLPPMGVGVHRIAMRLNDTFENFLNSHGAMRHALRNIYYGLGAAKPEELAFDTETLNLLKSEYNKNNKGLDSLLKSIYPHEAPAWVSQV